MPPADGTQKPRKPRPSRARGLRTTTGCLTCRKRRVKCDETKPQCKQCAKSERECTYGQSSSASADAPSVDGQHRSRQPSSSVQASPPAIMKSPAVQKSMAGEIDPQLFGPAESPELRFDLSPLTLTASLPSPNSAPFEWYDLLAEDAINNIQKHNLGFDQSCLSRRQSPTPEDRPSSSRLQPHDDDETLPPEPWRSPQVIPLNEDELNLFHHYVSAVGPILDLFDPLRQFTHAVPRLAIRNVGLLRSLLAVAARHMALHAENPNLSAQTPGSTVSESRLSNPLLEVATQYYYETLHYLSQNLLYPTYTKSSEIIATALLISTYEMFDASGRYSDGGWERHLRGIFWIQRSQDNNGETRDALRRAAWWSWIRQDIWVAFRENRRTLTIWRPTRRLYDLNPDDLATRVVYICARCVDFAANEKKYAMSIRIDQGDKLLQALHDWYRILPSSFQPIYTLPMTESSWFVPIWIHPPSHAAAIQMFHFARIIVIINQPSEGGMDAFRQRQRQLDESVETICGIAVMHQGKDLPSAFVNYQALYAAGLCVQTPIKQAAILELLEKTLDVTKFPPKTLLDDLSSYWRAES